MQKSPFGLALSATRESQDAADSMGVNVMMTKLKCFMIGAFFAGILGAFYAHYIKILTPTGVLGDGIMMEVVVMCILGGSGTVSGPIIGAFTVTILMESMRFLGDYRMLIYGLLVILLIIFMPDGIVGTYRFKIMRFVQRFFERTKKEKSISGSV